MSRTNVFCIIFYSYLISICKGSDLSSDRVKKYDSESFKVNVGGSIPHFINFYSPWCRSSERLKPVWDELAEKYNVDSPNQKLVIAQIDCTSETPLCDDENILRYPSLIFYDAGEKKRIKYQGRRDLTRLEEFISENIGLSLKKKTMPPVVNSAETTRELTDENFQSTISYGLHFVKFYDPSSGHGQKMIQSWEELAVNSQNDKSVTISSVDCSKHGKACEVFQVKRYPSLLWIVGGKKVKKYKGARNVESFKQFITEMKEAHKERLENEEGEIPDSVDSSMPPVVPLVETTSRELTEENFQSTISYGLHFVKFFAPSCRHSPKETQTWVELVENYQNDTSVNISSVDCSKHSKACQEFEVKRYPTLLWIFYGEKYEEYQGAGNLESFKQDITKMTEAYRRLENVDEMFYDYDDSSKPLPVPKVSLELTDENFQSTISYGLHFVKFYDPWCGYSVMMEDAWEELAANFQNDTSVTISSVDCTEHSKPCHEFEVGGYPTLLWIVDGKKVKKYKGTRNVESFTQFVTEMKEAHKERLENEEGKIPNSVDSSTSRQRRFCL